MNAIAKQVPELLGGAADLSTSTKTVIKDSPNFHLDPTGQNIFFGVREFGMCAIVNGMAAHGGVIPYGSTFFVFSDYAKPAIRLAALMQVHSLFIFTHDSIGLGEDGPTHQPVEHLTMLRAIPHLTDFRPADANETSAAWGLALERKGPAFMALSRQDLPLLDPVRQRVFEGVRHGAYIVEQGGDSPDLLIVGTGAELWPALRAAEQLKKDGISARVVSMPSCPYLRGAARQLQRFHLPRSPAQAGRRGGRHSGLVEIRGQRRRRDRARSLRRFGSGTNGSGKARLWYGQRRRSRKGCWWSAHGKNEPAMAGK